MRQVLRFSPSAVVPEPARLMLRAGLPENREPHERLGRLLSRAVGLFVEEAAPVGVTEEIALDELLALHHDSGWHAAETVLDRVAPRAEALAVFGATLGEPVCERIRALFDAGEAPLGFLLDAVASEAASRLADRLARAWLERLRDDGRVSGTARVLPYSPGYCGWDVRGQRALFARLRPEEAAIRLNESDLMTPVKSVSGALVAGTPAAHRFRTDFDFCDDCAERECRERIASLGAAGGEEGRWTS